MLSVLAAGGLAAAILTDSEGATALLAGTLTWAALAIVGGIISVRLPLSRVTATALR